MAGPRRRIRTSSLAKRLALQSAAGLDAAPPERFQHGQELDPPPMARAPLQIANGVRTMFHAGGIGDAAMTAAGRFHDDYVLGVLGVRDREYLRGSGGVSDPRTLSSLPGAAPSARIARSQP
jgi:hypothetical protein